MKTTKFKSNIKCAGCVEKVSPALNEITGKGNWEVDLKDPSRILTVQGDADQAKLNEALGKIGYRVDLM